MYKKPMYSIAATRHNYYVYSILLGGLVLIPQCKFYKDTLRGVVSYEGAHMRKQYKTGCVKGNCSNWNKFVLYVVLVYIVTVYYVFCGYYHFLY